MWYVLRNYFRDWWIVIPFLVALGLQVAMIHYGYTHIHAGGDQVFLRYTILVGPSLRGEWWKLYYLPALGCLIFLVHAGVGVFLYKRDKIFARILAISTGLLEIFIFVAFALLIGINF